MPFLFGPVYIVFIRIPVLETPVEPAFYEITKLLFIQMETAFFSRT